MTQFFNHQEAENFRLDVMEHFPQLHVDDVHDICDKETGAYQYSYFSIWFDGHKFHTYVEDESSWQSFLNVCQYVAGAIADNQQSEEVDRYHDPKWQGIHVNYPSTADNQQSAWSEESEAKYQEQVRQEQWTPKRLKYLQSFTDQNGLTVQHGRVYGIDEQGDLYDIEPLNRFRPSEF